MYRLAKKPKRYAVHDTRVQSLLQNINITESVTASQFRRFEIRNAVWNKLYKKVKKNAISQSTAKVQLRRNSRKLDHELPTRFYRPTDSRWVTDVEEDERTYPQGRLNLHKEVKRRKELKIKTQQQLEQLLCLTDDEKTFADEIRTLIYFDIRDTHDPVSPLCRIPKSVSDGENGILNTDSESQKQQQQQQQEDEDSDSYELLSYLKRLPPPPPPPPIPIIR